MEVLDLLEWDNASDVVGRSRCRNSWSGLTVVVVEMEDEFIAGESTDFEAVLAADFAAGCDELIAALGRTEAVVAPAAIL